MFSSEGAQRVLAGIVFLNIYTRRMDGLRNTSSSCRSPSTFVLLKKNTGCFGFVYPLVAQQMLLSP